MQINVGDKIICFDRPVVMGILNVTPDSFYAVSRMFDEEAVISRVREIRDQGAAIIDVGGYSSRPGAGEVAEGEELRRMTVGVAAVRKEAPGIVVSIDTFRAGVADEIIGRFGPCIVNDISAGARDMDMISVAVRRKAPFVAMHMRGTPADMQGLTQYEDVAAEVLSYLKERAGLLRASGVRDIILDPGFGFAKTTEQNYRLLSGMDGLSALGYPVLAGISRKGMIYKVLDKKPADSLSGTTALHWECLRKGAKILRVHDVAAAADVARIYEYYTRITTRP